MENSWQIEERRQKSFFFGLSADLAVRAYWLLTAKQRKGENQMVL